jgi:hypothetical protein
MLVALCAGCAELQDQHFRTCNRIRSQQAWNACVPLYDKLFEVSPDYRKGWKAGYYDVLTGGGGKPPAVPPSRYFCPYYQTPDGRMEIEYWYFGFHKGATAALGTRLSSELPLFTDVPTEIGIDEPFGVAVAMPSSMTREVPGSPDVFAPPSAPPPSAPPAVDPLRPYAPEPTNGTGTPPSQSDTGKSTVPQLELVPDESTEPK